jgi:hypothetical protein
MIIIKKLDRWEESRVSLITHDSNFEGLYVARVSGTRQKEDADERPP